MRRGLMKQLSKSRIVVLARIKNYVHQKSKGFRNQRKAVGKTKYFCVGRNKTGTTSLKVAFEDLGYPVGHQRQAEILAGKYYFVGNFQPIIEYCKTAQVFQDVPFSYPETYRHLDKAYPDSKFILTIRDDAEQWYQSITRFHSKLFGKNGQIPTVEDLKNATYVWPGFMYNFVRIHGTPDTDPYNKQTMIVHYAHHNQSIIEYFRDRPGDLLVINVGEEGAYEKFVDFLGVESPFDNFPWENRT